MSKVLSNIRMENCMSRKINAYEERKILGNRSLQRNKSASSSVDFKNNWKNTNQNLLQSRIEMKPVLWDRHQYA